jgi:hypothetical protein
MSYNGWKKIIDSSYSELAAISGGQKRVELGNVALTQVGASTAALLMGMGTSSTTCKTGTASKNFLGFWTESSATSGDSRGIYFRHYISGAGGSGETGRFYTTISDVAASTAHGIHSSLSFGTSGTVTGIGCAGRFTLHVPSGGAMAGTVTALQAEIWSDAATSDPAGATTISFMRFVNGGDTDGDDDVETDAVLFDLSGFTSGGVWTDTTSNAADEFIKCKTPSGIRYLILSDSTTFA